ncbi:MAG TPA: ureidoglycolate lyase [Thermoanaerobaculia bacterium]|nr:ureidoglycolate lyase [Thermoanaerobaculia bacterium]
MTRRPEAERPPTDPADALELVAEPLAAEAFAPFGEVIEAQAAEPAGRPTEGRLRHDGSDDDGAGCGSTGAYPINDGTARRRDHVARVDVAEKGGGLRVSVARAAPRRLPLLVERLERHPLGSQAFVPMTGSRFLVVVAPAARQGAGEGALRAAGVRAFVAGRGQGINYRRGVWHHPLSALDHETDFLVLDRDGPEENFEEIVLDRPVRVLVS